MAIRNYKPTTNARRGMSTLVNELDTKGVAKKENTVSLISNVISSISKVK